MAIAPRNDAYIRAVIFDLDEALLVRAPAWRYALEEAVLATTGVRIDAGPLAEEYRGRPFEHAIALVAPADVREECAELCREFYGRSAMKRLLIHEGLGMALDVLRGLRVEVGAISREPHALARKQIESTGLDRFVAALSCTPAGGRWQPSQRVNDCLTFFEQPPERCLFISRDMHDLREAAALGLNAYEAGWARGDGTGYPCIAAPGELESIVMLASARTRG